ncbi:MAG: hemolysin III family protein [Bacteroidaceae bacterium]
MSSGKGKEAEGFYTSGEEYANTLSHALGIVLGVVAGYYLLRKSQQDYSIALATPAVLIYLAGMLSSYISSTFYHGTTCKKLKHVLRKFDHAAIYWHIAGTYTPFTLIILWNDAFWGIGILTLVWFFAIIGAVLSFKHLKDHSNLETCCYILMGCTIFIALKPLCETLSLRGEFSSFYWLLGGGVSYVIGALFYTLHQKKYMHSVFHLFVLGGSICHIIAIWIIL